MNEMDNDELVAAVCRARGESIHADDMLNGTFAFDLMVECKIALAPPTSPVHRCGGANAGPGQSGVWTAYTWHRGVTGRRAFGMHDTDPVKAVLRCYVTLSLGDV